MQKSVLTAACPYFRLLYAYKNETCPEEIIKMEIEVQEITADTFECILDYIYTAEIKLTAENVQDVLQAAAIFLMPELKQVCCEFLEECMSPQNCLGIWDFTERYSCSWTHYLADQYIDKHFSTVCYSEEFLQLNFEQLFKILQRDTLDVKTESVIWEAALRWIKYDLENRVAQLPVFLEKCVRLCFFCPSHFVQEDLVRSTVSMDTFQDMLKQWECKKALLSQHKQSLCRGTREVIIIAGGKVRTDTPVVGPPNNAQFKPVSSVYCLKPGHSCRNEAPSWMPLPAMHHPRVGHAIVEAGGYVFVAGGIGDNDEVLTSCERYNAIDSTWTEMPPMKQPRVNFGLVAFKEEIFVLGGCLSSVCHEKPLSSVESFNIVTRTWRSVSEIPVPRVSAAYTVFEEKILMIGGFNNGKFHESVDCYDPKLDTWSSMPPLKERRFNAKAVTLANDVYVFGGLRPFECPSVAQNPQGGMKFCDSEFFSKLSNKWERMHAHNAMCNMQHSSEVQGAVAAGDTLVVAGKLDVGGMFHFLRFFHSRTGFWHTKMPNPPIRISGEPVVGSALAVVKIPRNKVF